MQFDSNKKPKYIFKHPFRFVKPYPHIFQTHSKQRWLGKNLLATLAKQFQAYSEQYFQQAIKVGKVLINGKKVELDYKIKNSDLLQHETIREQPPILDLPIEIIHEDQQFLVVCKPPSMVVHTGGGYHYNTLMAILYYEMGYQNLYILHRIDRLTSGVVILSKKKQKTTKFHEQSMQQVMKKCYFARVSGDFKEKELIFNAPMICLSHREGIWGIYNRQTMKDILKTQQPKQSTTKFIKIWYDQSTNSSLLECYPITGRTHQIRVHLSHIGHPILNDIVYNGKFVGNWIVNTIKKQQQKQIQKSYLINVDKNSQNLLDNKQKQQKQQVTQNINQKKQKQLGLDLQYSKWDYKQRPMEIFLHSFKYKFEGKQYVSHKPYWVEPSLSIVQILSQKINKTQEKNISNYQLQFLSASKQKYQKQHEQKISQIQFKNMQLKKQNENKNDKKLQN